MLKLDLQLFAHKKGMGSTKNGRDSDENVSTKVVKIIQSYTGIVNKMVWRKI